MAKVFKIKWNSGKRSTCYYGKVKVGSNEWRRKKLFSDRLASERRLSDLQRNADLVCAGVKTVAIDNASIPITTHIKDYLAALRLQKRGGETLRIAEWTLNRLKEWGKWQRLRDISADGMRTILQRLDGEGKTASYQNKFIMRAKAFVHWLIEEHRLAGDSLANLKRVDERTGTRKRARRALTDTEVSALLKAAPKDRQEKYAWAIFAGLRRGELVDLRWGDLRLHSPRPFIQLREEQTKNAKADVLPLHPYLIKLVTAQPASLPEMPVVSSVPDMKTMRKDLDSAGVKLVDGMGKRADFHALRHTFCTNLDRTGCSYTTKRALMRHSDSGVTEGYSQARLEELYTAIERLPSPGTDQAQGQAAVKTGTDDTPAVPADQQADQKLTIQRLSEAVIGSVAHSDLTGSTGQADLKKTWDSLGNIPKWLTNAVSSLMVLGRADNVPQPRPSTQVDYPVDCNSLANRTFFTVTDQQADQTNPRLASVLEIINHLAAQYAQLHQHKPANA